jgi:hypothetical protein
MSIHIIAVPSACRSCHMYRLFNCSRFNAILLSCYCYCCVEGYFNFLNSGFVKSWIVPITFRMFVITRISPKTFLTLGRARMAVHGLSFNCHHVITVLTQYVCLRLWKTKNYLFTMVGSHSHIRSRTSSKLFSRSVRMCRGKGKASVFKQKECVGLLFIQQSLGIWTVTYVFLFIRLVHNLRTNFSL